MCVNVFASRGSTRPLLYRVEQHRIVRSRTDRKIGGFMGFSNDSRYFMNIKPYPKVYRRRFREAIIVGYEIKTPLKDFQRRFIALPSGFTRISLDGNADDWDTSLLPFVTKDLSHGDIQQVRAFYNDQYLYLLIETTNRPCATPR